MSSSETLEDHGQGYDWDAVVLVAYLPHDTDTHDRASPVIIVAMVILITIRHCHVVVYVFCTMMRDGLYMFFPRSKCSPRFLIPFSRAVEALFIMTAAHAAKIFVFFPPGFVVVSLVRLAYFYIPEMIFWLLFGVAFISFLGKCVMVPSAQGGDSSINVGGLLIFL